MWTEIAKLIGANPITTLVITIIGTTTIWLYKEFKAMINQNTKMKLQAIDEKIKIYSQLQAGIASVIHGADNNQLKLDLMKKMGEYSPYLGEEVRQITRDFYKQGDTSYLVSMLAFIDVDIKRLEKERRRADKYDHSTDVSEIVLRIYDPLKPIASIWVIIVFLLLFVGLYLQQNFWYDKLFVIVLTVSSFTSLIVASAIVSLRLDKELPKQGFSRWIMNVTFVIAPVIATVHKGLSLLAIVIQALIILSLLKMKKEKSKQIITFD